MIKMHRIVFAAGRTGFALCPDSVKRKTINYKTKNENSAPNSPVIVNKESDTIIKEVERPLPPKLIYERENVALGVSLITMLVFFIIIVTIAITHKVNL